MPRNQLVLVLLVTLGLMSLAPGPEQGGWTGLCNEGCQEEVLQPQVRGEIELQALVAGSTAFALDLYRKLRDLPGNLFLSPYNISLCRAMAYAGAWGETEREMAQALHFSQDLLHPTFSALDQSLRDRAEWAGIALTTANAFWEEKQWPFRSSYKDLLTEHYRAELFEIPFATDPEGSGLEINLWVSDRTQGKIPGLLPPGSVDALTRLVLTSAIYFYGTWKYQFDPALARKGISAFSMARGCKSP